MILLVLIMSICLTISDNENYSFLGDGECRQSDGQYPLKFSKSYHDLSPWTDGDNAQQARNRCKELCMQFDWCYATEVVVRDIWPTPYCRLITDRATYENVYGTNQQYYWGYMATIDNVQYQTYCGGNGDCSATNWDGGSLNQREGYECWIKESGSRGTLNYGDVATGSITSGQIAYYRVNINDDEPMVVFEACGSEYDTWLHFYDSNMNAIQSCDDCNHHGSYCGTRGDLSYGPITAGVYYLGIGGYSSSAGNYVVSMTQHSIKCGDQWTGDITSYDKDFFRFEAPSSYSKIYLEACGSDYDTWLYLYDNNMNSLYNCDDCNTHGTYCQYKGDLTVTSYITGGNTYYFGVGGYSSRSGTYSVSLVCEGASAHLEGEKHINNFGLNSEDFEKKFGAKKNIKIDLSLSSVEILACVIFLLLLVNVGCMVYSCKRYRTVSYVSVKQVDSESEFESEKPLKV